MLSDARLLSCDNLKTALNITSIRCLKPQKKTITYPETCPAAYIESLGSVRLYNVFTRLHLFDHECSKK